ncbi:hypothetical protein [uncultured Methanomethylovorans sp.]|uniref:hypothetical protein n=1 Tax=uncultured Methanomethylovorans sp. TaxID=183759 RepID=UPI002AA80E6A|nr:hypothetical protein [uncultured Methanomethylovorans sp.]
MCFNIHPLNGLAIDDTYTTCKEGAYAEEGVVCQNFHMTLGITALESIVVSLCSAYCISRRKI